jgi:hypothetical protein
VQTRIIRPSGGQPLRVDWRIRETNGGFAIIDVIAEVSASWSASATRSAASSTPGHGRPDRDHAAAQRQG